MLTITPTGAILGATVEGLDLARPMSDATMGELLAALGENGFLRFPAQTLKSAELKAFSERFGDIQEGVAKPSKYVDCPGVGILSNIKVDGEYIGFPDAGQDWHTDMTYREVMGFVNVLYAIEVPRRDGKVLGGTEFANMHMAYDALPDEIKARLKDAICVHNFEKMWEHMRQNRGSSRPPMSDEQRRRRPIRSPAGKCSTPTPATPSASSACRSRKATPCWPTCSPISSRRASATPSPGPRATSWSGTISARCIAASPTTARTSIA